MARIKVANYVFAPGLANVGTVKVPGLLHLSDLLMITNTTKGEVIYNFSDTTKNATISYSSTDTTTFPNYGNGVTTITLEYDTSSHSSADKLLIFTETSDSSVRIRPYETMSDAVEKFRVSSPQSLIDTDFEYSTQPSKWEALPLIQNYPSFYTKGSSGTSFEVTAISGGNQSPRSTISVTTSVAHGLVAGDVVVVRDSTNVLADGTFIVDSVPSGTTLTYTAKGVINGSILDSTYTTISGGGIYPGARIPLAVSATAMTYSGTTITVDTANAHGLFPGTPIQIRGVTATTNPPNGNWIIDSTPLATRFTFTAAAAPTGTLASGTNFASCLLYTRPEGYQLHRATDGGVLITTGGNYTGNQYIRQTRRYFRYQSGKGLQFSTGAKFTPTFDVSTISASGTTVTITTLQEHNLQVGAGIKIEGVVSASGDADSALYNRSSTTVTSIVSARSFTYSTTSAPTDTAPGGSNVFVTAVNWLGAVVRSGLFDEQNGFFFEYDGTTLNACLRDSIKELFGTVSVTQDSGTVTGTSTRFREQLVSGDKIVIKGQSYEVAEILSDTSLRINPIYRGPSRSNVRYLKTQTRRFPQSQWNLDKMDGTGPSGYNLDISKMQMAYIDYTWYGAGHIRFGFRSVDGHINYCHKIVNNNVNNAAYMRSGNLPGRFEALNSGSTPCSRVLAGATATRGSTVGTTDTTIYIESVTGWPSTGYVMMHDGTNNELMRYTAIGAYNSTVRGYPLTVQRRATYSIAGINPAGSFSTTAYTFSGNSTPTTFNPDSSVGGSATPQLGIQYIYNDCAPVVSHWGVSVIMDGRYDDDKSIVFTAGMNRYLSVGAGVTRPLLAIRIAPSVDSGIGKNFGIREILNRMQLTLNGMDVYAAGQFLVQGILNPLTLAGTGLTFPAVWETIPVGSGSLAQVVYFDGTQTYAATAATSTGTFTGGDRIFGFYTDNAGGANFAATSYDLTKVRDLGTSILSGPGDTGAINPGYPAGPDVLVITATNLANAGSSNLACRISWTEAQA